MLLLAPWIPNWNHLLQIVQPDTLLRWHREGFRLLWKLESHTPVQTQPQRLAVEVIVLIQRLGDTFFTQALPALRQWSFGPAEARRTGSGLGTFSRVVRWTSLAGRHWPGAHRPRSG